MNNKKIFFPRPLREVLAGRAKVRGTEQGNNLIIYPSSVCWNFVPQTTSPARGEDKRQGGFTLIELLVVVLIIGILAAVALPQYKFAVAKTRLVQLVTAAQSIKQAEEAYYLANGEYTNDWTVLDVDFAGNVSSANSRYFYANTGWGAELEIAANWVALWDGRVPEVRLYYSWDHASTLPGSKQCYAHQTSSAANELCKYITKRTSRNGTDGRWHYYRW